MGSFYVIDICTVGYGGYYAKRIALGLVSIFQALHFYQHYLAFGETMRVIPLRVLGVVY